MAPATVVIRKYGNRRLYDTTGSRYVNLQDIAAFIRSGKDVRVEDAKSGKDLTRVTLTQIITEDAKEQPTGLPLELLRELIVASDQARQEFIMWYLKSAFDTYQSVQRAVQNRIGNMQAALLSPVESMKRLLSPPSEAQPAEANEELRALRQRVAQLEGRLKKLPRKRRVAPKPRSNTRTARVTSTSESSHSTS
jgi:polyhydroxyalkanoate synthesis repressor PhaR